jgi:putative intracellular protease/amidase
MGKVLIYIYDGMADFEITLLAQLLVGDCGMDLLVVSSKTGVVKSKSGMMYMPNIDMMGVKTNDVDAIIIPGGWLADLDDKLIEIIKELNNENKLIAAICAAPWILAKGDVLKNRKYTTSIVEWLDKHRDFFKMEDPFDRNGYIEARVVRDNNIITAKGVAFIDFAIEVCDYLGLFEDENEKLAFINDIKGFIGQG